MSRNLWSSGRCLFWEQVHVCLRKNCELFQPLCAYRLATIYGRRLLHRGFSATSYLDSYRPCYTNLATGLVSVHFNSLGFQLSTGRLIRIPCRQSRLQTSMYGLPAFHVIRPTHQNRPHRELKHHGCRIPVRETWCLHSREGKQRHPNLRAEPERHHR